MRNDLERRYPDIVVFVIEVLLDAKTEITTDAVERAVGLAQTMFPEWGGAEFASWLSSDVERILLDCGEALRGEGGKRAEIVRGALR